MQALDFVLLGNVGRVHGGRTFRFGRVRCRPPATASPGLHIWLDVREVGESGKGQHTCRRKEKRYVHAASLSLPTPSLLYTLMHSSDLSAWIIQSCQGFFEHEHVDEWRLIVSTRRYALS